MTNRWRSLSAPRFLVVLTVALSFGLAFSPLSAAEEEWPEVVEGERQLTAVDGFPDVDAVVLQKRGRLVITEQGTSSRLEIFERVKVLNEAGMTAGTVSLFGTSDYRIRDLEGRTHTPDGRVVELSEESTFSRNYDEFYDASVISFVMPEVQPGAIIEYRYKMFFDSWAFSSPWYFQARLPVLYSEVIYDVSETVGFVLLPMVPPNLDITHDSQRGNERTVVTYRGRNLPPVPQETHRFPFVDLAAQINFLPQSKFIGNQEIPFFKNWESAWDVVDGDSSYGYRGFKRDCGDAKRQAKALRAEGASSLNTAREIFRFVRDEISTLPSAGVAVLASECDDIFEARRGSFAQKGLLLHYMLDAVKIDSSFVWARTRKDGRAQPNFPNPYQFERLLVEVKLEGQTYLLDAGDPDVAFGALSPWLEGTQALRVGRDFDPEWFEIPFSASETSRQTSKVELEVGPSGGVAGSGRVEFAGHSAWSYFDGRLTVEALRSLWKEWLEAKYPGFDITEVVVQERVEDRAISVQWRLTLREDEVLDDEVLLGIAAPLGSEGNPFSLPTNLRLTPVQFAFPWQAHSEVRITWPSGWSPEGIPQPQSLNTPVGRVLYQVDGSVQERWISVRREFTLENAELIGREAYDHLRRLYGAATAGDAEEVILVADDSGGGR